TGAPRRRGRGAGRPDSSVGSPRAGPEPGARGRAAPSSSRPPAAAARGAPGAAVAFAWPSAGLPVQGVASTPAAVLAELDPVGGVPLRLLRLVVAALALGASEGDRDSYSGGHLFLSVPSLAGVAR